jgi:hypothetical protein
MRDERGTRYRLRIRGHLDPAWSSWFDGLTIRQRNDGTTTLTGPLVDQAELYGLLGRLRDLGATLLGVQRLPPDEPAARRGAVATTDGAADEVCRLDHLLVETTRPEMEADVG